MPHPSGDRPSHPRKRPLRPRTLRKAPLALALAVLLASVSVASAQTIATWDTVSGEWTLPANWSTAPLYPHSPDDEALFTGVSTMQVSVAAPVSVGSLALSGGPVDLSAAAASSGALTFSSTTGQTAITISGVFQGVGSVFTLPVTLASNLTITNTSNSPFVLAGTLSGSGNLTIAAKPNSAGVVDLSGNSPSWEPALITVSTGTLDTLGGTFDSLGDPNTGTLTVASGATVRLFGLASTSSTQSFNKTLQLAGSGTSTFPGALAFASGTTTLGGPIALTGTTALYGVGLAPVLNIGAPSGPSGAAALSGSGQLVAGGGLIQLNIPATYTGGTQINGGTLAISPSGSLVNTGPIAINILGTLAINKPAGANPASNGVSPNSITLNSGGVLDIKTDMSLANLFSPAKAVNGTIDLDTPAPFTNGGSNLLDLSALPSGSSPQVQVGASGILPATLSIIPPSNHVLNLTGTFTDAASITDNGTNSTVLSLGGNGTITLAATSSYTGVTAIGAVVVLNSPAGLGSPAKGTIVNAGNLILNVATTEPLSLIGGAITANVPYTGTITASGGTLFQQGSGSFAAGGIVLNGARLSLGSDISIAGALNPNSQGGYITIDSSTPYTAGGTNLLDFSALPGNPNLYLAAGSNASLAASLVLKPDASTRTLRFGDPNLTGTLTVNSAIADYGASTMIQLLYPSALVLNAASSYSGQTADNGILIVNNNLALGTGSGTDADSTIVGSTGELLTGAGVTLANEKVTSNGGTLFISTTGPTVLAATSTLWGFFAGPLTGPGGAIIYGASAFAAPMDYTGSTSVYSTLTLTDASGVGTASAGITIYQAGILDLNATCSAAITLAGGTLNLGPIPSVDGAITSFGGSITSYAGTVAITNGLSLVNGTTLALSGNFTIHNGLSLTGTLLLGNPQNAINANIDGPITGNGPIQINNGTVTLSNSPAISAPITTTSATLTITSIPSINSLTLQGASQFTTPISITNLFNQGGPATFSAAATVNNLQIIQGTVEFDGPANITSLTTILAGSLTFAAAGSSAQAFSGAGTLIIAPGASLTSDGVTESELDVYGTQSIRPDGAPQGTSVVSALFIASDTAGHFTGKLDIANNAFIVEASGSANKALQIAALQAAVLSAKSNGAWTGNGLTSSAVATDAATQTAHSYKTTLAIADNAGFLTPFTSFGGRSVDASSILITRALVADGDFNNTVNNADLVILLTHYGLSGQTQSTGDYDGNGTVDNADLVALLTNYGQSLPTGDSLVPAETNHPSASANSLATPVPEPAALALLLPFAGLVFGRRRRRVGAPSGNPVSSSAPPA